jgi:hypothetical protein
VSKRVSVRFEQVGSDGTIAQDAVAAQDAADHSRPSDALAGAWERN